tara:strand:- start:152 stop:421 length:270 start_codon:yes stop_codon:yes gene_type:complete
MRVRLLITGRVQGVGYRYHTCQQARKRGLLGWVKNQSDGSVEAEIQGEAEDVNDMIAWCERGPTLANVRQVTVTPCELCDGESDFRQRS